MVNVRFYRNPEQGTVQMEMDGHAGAAPKGRDLVCAGMSTLAYTAGQAVWFLHQNGMLKCEPVVEIEEGKAYICAAPKEECQAETLCVFFTVQAGVYVLASDYQEYVKLLPMKSFT